MDVNSPSDSKTTIRPLSIVALAVVFWVALVLLFAAQFVIVGAMSWHAAFIQALFFWGLWGLFMPVAMLLSFRFPFEPGRISTIIPIHILACVLVTTASQLAFRDIFPPPPPPGETSQPPPAGDNARIHKGFLSIRAGMDVLVYWALFAGCQGITHFRRSQQRERRAAELEARLARSKLQALRMQINPHFLFNTLNAISTLIYVNPRTADEMLGDLSELLRRCLDNMEEQEIPLGRELQFIHSYIGIEQRRFGERLRAEQTVPDELLPAYVPALILQPLVENAIRHGIEPQRQPGLVSIQAVREGQHLCLTVRDNGRGLVAANQYPKRAGIGLTNTQARLRELYGPDHRFSFAQNEPRGCVVQIRIPYHTTPWPAPGTNALS
jgi:signal transduction histidine kinase